MSDFLKKAKNAYQKAVGQTNKAIEAGKVQITISQLKGDNNNLFRKIGKIVYDKSQTNEQVSSISLQDKEILDKIESIKANMEKIKELEKEGKNLFE